MPLAGDILDPRNAITPANGGAMIQTTHLSHGQTLAAHAQTIPMHIDAAIRALGVVPARHTPVYIHKPEPYKAWKPQYDGEECPF